MPVAGLACILAGGEILARVGFDSTHATEPIPHSSREGTDCSVPHVPRAPAETRGLLEGSIRVC